MGYLKKMVVGGAAILVSVGAAHARDAAEQSYVQSAQTVNQAELGLGQLAQQRGSSDAVKQMSRARGSMAQVKNEW